jgi:hypothetical protein
MAQWVVPEVRRDITNFDSCSSGLLKEQSRDLDERGIHRSFGGISPSDLRERKGGRDQREREMEGGRETEMEGGRQRERAFRHCVRRV